MAGSVNTNGSGGPGAPISTDDDLVSARSFVVRALLEESGWHGFVTDTASGERQGWRRPADVARFVERQLARVPDGSTRTARLGAVVAGPTLTEVVTDMLAVLGARLPAPAPTLPEPNVTLERVTEKLAGLGNQTGTEPAALGTRTLRGGRLDARVRFQLWGGTAPAVDSAVVVLHSDLLDDREQLRTAGFLRFNAAETTLAEEFETVGGWRKTTSFDVLYEYRYVDSDDADSLIARIQVTTDPEQPASPAREQETITDELVRWDDEAAPELVVTGPTTIHRISALVFEPGPAIGGTVTIRRTDGSATPPVVQPDLTTFLAAAATSTAPTEMTVAPVDLFAGIGPAGTQLELGDWNTDALPDQYAGFDRVLDQPIELARSDRLSVTYSGPGLDQTAVVYLRLNQPD